MDGMLVSLHAGEKVIDSETARSMIVNNQLVNDKKVNIKTED